MRCVVDMAAPFAFFEVASSPASRQHRINLVHGAEDGCGEWNSRPSALRVWLARRLVCRWPVCRRSLKESAVSPFHPGPTRLALPASRRKRAPVWRESGRRSREQRSSGSRRPTVRHRGTGGWRRPRRPAARRDSRQAGVRVLGQGSQLVCSSHLQPAVGSARGRCQHGWQSARARTGH